MAIFAALEDNQKTKAELEELKHQLFRENVRIQQSVHSWKKTMMICTVNARRS